MFIWVLCLCKLPDIIVSYMKLGAEMCFAYRTFQVFAYANFMQTCYSTVTCEKTFNSCIFRSTHPSRPNWVSNGRPSVHKKFL